jgi:hypothetical protein
VGDEIPDKAARLKLAAEVARGLSASAAGRALKIPERTARRIARGPKFRAEVDRLRREMLDATGGAMAALSVQAVATMGKLLKSENEDIALKAARGLLADMLAFAEFRSLSERLEALEERLGGEPTRGGPRGWRE